MKSLRLSRPSRTSSWLIATVSLLAIGSALAQRDRITHVLDNYRTVVVPGQVNPMAKAEFDRGAVPGTFALRGLTLTVRRTAAQQKDLNQLLASQQNPSSRQYHKWLTPEAFAKRFGASSNDLATLRQWLEGQGFQIRAVARGGTFIRFDGTAAQVSKAFATEIHHYSVKGVMHYANAREPSLPATLAPLVLAVGGMNDFVPRPNPAQLAHGKGTVKAHYIDGYSSNDLGPADLATIYDLGALQTAGAQGVGQTVVVIGFSDVTPADVTAYCANFSLTCGTPTQVFPDGDPGNDGAMMATRDLELVSAVAPGAALVLDADLNPFNAFTDAVDNQSGQIILMNLGMCETQLDAGTLASFQSGADQAGVTGITLITGSGDSGAAACETYPIIGGASNGLAVTLPAALPEFTAVGGTAFTDQTGTYWSASNSDSGGTALSYVPEAAWNDTAVVLESSQMFEASGGGVSTLFPTPSWQAGTANILSTGRNVPDVALAASMLTDPYFVMVTMTGPGGPALQQITMGGTESSAAVFAGMVALINESQGALGLGNVNPTLYELAGSGNGYTGSAPAFHDITTGDNIVPCLDASTDCPSEAPFQLGYSAGAGYDRATGLGSVDASNLNAAWTGTPLISSLSVSSATAGRADLSLTINGTGFADGSTVTWTFGGETTTLTGATCAASPCAVTVPSADLATAGAASIQVVSAASINSNSAPFTINAPPAISSLSVSAATAGHGDLAVTIAGTGFTSGSTVQWNASPLAVSPACSTTSCSVTVPLADLATAGSGSITVVSADGVSSSPATFTINPAPSIGSLSVSAATAGHGDLPVTIWGTNFASGYAVQWNASTLTLLAPCDTTSCSATVPLADLATVGSGSITVVSADGVSSLPATFTINNAPVISSLSPTAVVVTSTATLVTIGGNYFTSGSTLYWTPPAGATTPTSPGTISSRYSSATSMSVILPSSYLQTAGNGSFQVVSADGVSSVPATFTVSPSATITYLSPSYATMGNPGFTLTVNGTGFVSGSQLAWNGTAKTTTPVGNPVTSLTCPITTAMITGASAAVTVVNPDTTISVAKTFTINAAPAIASTGGLTPAAIAAGSGDTAVAIAGSGFTSKSTVTFTPPGSSTSYPVASSYGSAAAMSATVPSAFLTAAGAASMQVVSGDAVSSASATFTVNPTAVITYLSPNHATAGRTAVLPLTVNGSGFLAGTTNITFNGTTISPACTATTTRLTCSISAALVVNSTAAPVTVPVVTVSGASSPVNFTVNPAPAIASDGVSPASAKVGASHALLTITGTNFTSGSTVTWTPTGSLSGAGIPVTLSSLLVSATSLTATAPSTLLTAAGSANINVVSLDGGSSNTMAFTISPNPPTVSNLSPSTATAGNTAGVMVTITGTNFTSKSTVTWTPPGSETTPVTLASSYSTAASITATVPFTDLATAGTATIIVQGANGATSGTPFTINAAPVITSLSPSAASAGSGSSVPLTVTGTGFTTGSNVTWKGQSGKVYTISGSACASTVKCTATVPASYLTTAGLAPVTVKTADGVNSNAMNFSVASAVITGFTPNSENVGSSAFVLAVNGSGFVNGAQITFGTAPMTTAFVSGTQLTAQIPASYVSTKGQVMVAVVNEDGTTSVPVPFTISDYNVPTITKITPTSVTAGASSVTITVTGANFVVPVTTGSGTHAVTTPGSQIYVNGSQTNVTTAAKGTATSITATISGGIANAGPVQVTVVSGSAPNTVTSAAIPFTVIGPTITSVSPSSIAAGTPGTTVTVTGANFLALPTGKNPVVGSQLCVGGSSTNVTVTKGTATSITATLPSTMLASPGALSLTVQNTGTSGCPSAPAYILNVGAPVISSLTPASAAAGFATSKASLTLTVMGSNFVSGTNASQVYWGTETTPLTTVVKSATELLATVTVSELSCCVTDSTTSAGPYNIMVKNGSVASSPSTFTVLAPMITSLSPSTAAAGTTVKLTVNGTNFVASSVVTWGTTALTTKYVNATQLTATATAGSAGGVSVSVQNGAATPLAYGFFDVGSLLPSAASAGSADLVITINGTGFATGAVGKASVAMWGTTALTTTYVNATQVTATVGHALLASAGTTAVTVKTGTATYSAGTFTVTAPAISSLSATSAVAGSVPFTLTVSGTNFIGGSSKVWWGAESSPLATSYVPGSSDGSVAPSLTASVTSTELATSGPVNVTVMNGAGTTVSNIVVFTVDGPTISALSPTNLVAGSGATVTLTVTGTNFVSGANTQPSTVMWNGVALGTTTYLDPTHLTAPIAPAQLLSAGAQSVTVQNGPSTAASAASAFTVNPPTLTSLSPASTATGASGFTLTVTGTNFVSGAGSTPSTVYWDSTALTTTPVDGTHVTAAVLTGQLASAGVHNITVQNGVSAVSASSLPFGIGLAVESLSPAAVPVGSAGFTLTVNGSNFVNGGANPSTIMWNGVALGTTTFVNANQLTAPFTTPQLASASANSITVQNGVSGTPSNGITFTVGAPTISSLSATSAAAGSAAFTLTVTGTNFVSGAGTTPSTVYWGGTALTTTPVDSTHITAAVTGTQLGAAATPSITAQNGAVVSAQSPTFTVGAPTISSLSPSTAVATDTPFTLTVNGTNFVNGTNASVVMWGATALTTTYVSATQITAAVTPTQLASAATPSITVVNGSATPASGGSTFTVSAAPTVTLLSKTSITHGGAQFTLTVTGTNFLTGSTVMFGTTALATTFVSDTSLTAVVTTTAIHTAESIYVTVAGPGGATSATGTASAFKVN